MHEIRSSRDGSNAFARFTLLIAVLAASVGCRDGHHPIVFPRDDASAPREDGGREDASTGRDAGNGEDGGTKPGRDAATNDDAGRDGGGNTEGDATIDSSTPAANHAPVAVDISVQTDEDMAVSDTLPASDADGDAVSYEIVAQPAHGTVVLDADSGDITYTPDADFHGSDSFTFQASDGKDDSAIATVEIEVLSVNDAPVATGSNVEGEEDTEINPLTLNASDVDGDTLTYTVVDAPSHGLLSGSGSTRIYTPDANFAGADSLTFRVSDGKTSSATVTVAIEITAVNDAPSVTGEGIDVLEGGTATTLASGADSVLDNDSDVEGALTASVVTAPAHGTLTLLADGTFSYTHDGSETTSDSFVYAACDDAATPACSNGTVNIAITAVDDAPIAVDDALTVAEGGTATTLTGGASSVIGNDSDAEGETLTVNTTPTVAPAHGTLTLLADGTFSYTHDDTETTSDSFSYQVCDQAPALCATATVTITITPVNEQPSASDDAIALNEGATATTLVSNGDDSVLDNDTDPDGDTLIASLVTGPAHGTLTLRADGTFSYVHDGSEAATSDSFTYQACDAVAGGLCDSATVSITVTLVNDAPVAVDDAIDLDEGATATTLTGGGSDLRANDTDEESGALTVVIMPVTDPAHGTVTLNADGTFSYTHDGSETTSDSFQYSVCDPGSACATGTVHITITPVNDAPLAGDDTVTVAEGGTVTMTSAATPSSDLRSNDVDPELQALTVTVTPVTGPAHGTLTLGADGTFSYTHDGSETISDSFEYEVCDPSSACDIAQVDITITPVNEAPVVASETISVGEGLTASVLDSTDDSVLANDSDPDGDPLTAVLVTGPAHGALTLNADGTFSYTHDGSETTSDGFTYEACDDDVAQLCTSSAVAITIAPSNDAPTAVDDNAVVIEGDTINVAAILGVLVNDSDPDSATLTASLWSSPSHGSAIVNADGSYSYTHDGSESGSDSFEYQVCDDAAVPACDIGTVDIGISPVNDAPDAVDDVIVVNEGGTATQTNAPASSLTANDTDAEADALTVTLVNPGPAHGTLTLNPDGTFSYTHDGSETTSDDFQYTVCDSGPLCDTANVHIIVNPVNDPPVPGDDAIAVNEGELATTLVGGGTNLLANDTDAETPGQLSVTTSPIASPAHGSVGLNSDGTFGYLHDGSETTSDSFKYQVCDPNPGGQCAVGTVTITITPVNDAPVAGTDSIAVNEGGTTTTLAGGAGNDLRANDTDAESPAAALVLDTTLVVQPAHGTATVNADGTFSYTHDGSETTTDTFTYKVCDPSAACGDGVVNVSVVPVNEAPMAFVDTMTGDEGGTITVLDSGKSSLLDNDTDPDGDNLTAVVDVPPAHGTVTINPDGTFSYTHDGSETTFDAFTYKACDDDPIQLCGSGGVVVNINPVNDAPVAGSDGYTVAENGTLLVPAPGVLGNDSDAENGTLSASIATAPAHGSATVNADGSFSYTQNGDESATDSLTYQVCDDATPTPGCSTGTVDFTINPVNDAPVAVDDAISVNEGATASALAGGATSVGANDSDAENDPRTYALFGATTAFGTLTFNGDGTFSYTHDGSENHSDGFDYEVCDGPSSCDVGHVAITVAPVNDPPVANDDAFTVAEGGTATSLTGGASSVLANDSDPDSTLTVSSVSVSPQHAASFTLNGDGTFSYTHDGSETTSDSFSYQTCDGALPTPACATATVTITVTPVDDAPAGTADSASVAEGGTVSTLAGPASSVLANDTDAESDALVAVLGTGPAHGSLTLNGDGTFSYTHDGGETTSDSFTYEACEQSSPTTCSSATTVSITVTPVDDAPIAGDDAIVVNEGATATTLSPSGSDLRANDSDAEGDALSVVTTAVTAPLHGALTLNADGTFSYTHDGGETTSDGFVYRVCETAAPAVCDDAAVAITINPVNDAPVGGSYSYGNVVGNTLYIVDSSGLVDSSVKLGSLDTDAEAGSVLSITAMDASSAQGGTVTNLGGGAFRYLPAAGFLGADSFKYTISDDGTPVQSTQVTVSITVVGPMIWYVDGSNAGPSDGRSSRPFTSLASADSAAAPIADTRIYVAAGTYNSAVALVAGQTLHGAGDAFVPTTSVNFAAGTRPLISVAGNAVTVTSNNNVHGLDITSTGANAVNGAGTGGTIAISNATITASNGTGINITGASQIALGGLGTITAQSGIVTSGTTGLAAVGGNAITTTNGPALDINGGTLNATFGAITSTTSSTFGVRIQNNTSSPSFTASSITVSNPVAAGIAISGASGGSYALGNCNVTQAGTSPGTAGDAYSFTASPTTAFSLAIIADPATQNGRGLVVANTGTVTIGSVPATFSATGGAAIDLTSAAGNVASSNHWRFNALSSTNSSAQGIKLSTLSNAVEVQGATTITNATSEGIRSDDTSADLTFAAVTVNARNNAGIFINNADNSLVGFGAVTIPNPKANAQTAFTIQNSNANVSVLSTTISAAATALALSANTGGSFTLNSAGGATGDGGTISGSTGTAVTIANAADISLDDLIVTNTVNGGANGIDVTGVDDFTLRNSEVSKTGDADSEIALSLHNMTGNVLIDDDLITNMADTGIDLTVASGTANVKVLNTDISHNDGNTFCGGAACSGNGLTAVVSGSATLNLLVDTAKVELIDAEGIQAQVSGSAVLNATIRNSTFPNGSNGDSAIKLDQSGGTLRYDLNNNTVNGWAGHVIVATTNAAGGTLIHDGTIRGNTIVGTPLFGNDGIRVLADLSGSPTFTGKANITGNTISSVNGRGIQTIIRGTVTNSILHSRLLGNAVSGVGGQDFQLVAQNTTSACARVGDVTHANSAERNNGGVPGAGNAYQFNRTGTAVMQVEGATSPATEMPLANTGTTTTGASAGFTMVAANTCLPPALPVLPP